MSGTRITFRTRLKEYLAMEPWDLIMLTRDGRTRFSAKMARRIYENSTDIDVRSEILLPLAWDDEAPWRVAYLWRELEKHKDSEFGEWLLIRMQGLPLTLEGVRKGAALFYDPDAHRQVRVGVILWMSLVIDMLEWPDYRCHRDRQKIHEIATSIWEEYLSAPHLYACAGAGCLFENLGGLESDVE